MAELKLPQLAILLCLVGTGFLRCGYAVRQPTIAHAHQPFTLPRASMECILDSLQQLKESIDSNAVYPRGTRFQKTVECSDAGEMLLRLTLFNSTAVLARKEETGEVLRGVFTALLKRLRATLKLRYEWVVIMSGQYWVEYYRRIPVKNRLKGDFPKLFSGSTVNTSSMGNWDCLPRGDVLVSNNGAAGAQSGFDMLFAPHSLVSQNDHYFLLMQGDCNLVLYTAEGLPLWNSHTHGAGPSCRLALLRDGNLVISDGTRRIWESGSSISCSSVFILILQNDGNAVIYDILSGVPIWATGTNQ